MSIDASLLTKETPHYENIPDDYIRAIELAIRRGWEYLVENQKSYKVSLEKDDEPFITDGLVRVINLLRDTDSSFSELKRYFESVVAGAQYLDCKGALIPKLKQPDIVFKPKYNPYPGVDRDYYAYFIEAKIISDKRKPRLYFTDGLMRFIDGNYAWAMRQGMMLAYTRGEFPLPSSIDSYLGLGGNKEKYKVVNSSFLARPPNPIPKIYSTIHGRDWSAKGCEGSPDNIEIRHLWLNAMHESYID